jgi:RNA polymerase sigma-70 factor (ECF subfamily)
MNDYPDIEQLRPRLLAVAYRMLGGAADAEDAVQDAFLRFHQQAEGTVESPEAWLVKTTTRLCIDRLRRSRREDYVGPWLPEPVPETWPGAAADRVELAESLSMAFLVLLESLSPVERAAYLLREVFGYEYDEIGDLLDKTPANVRQITARARKRLEVREPRFAADDRAAEELAGRFFAACQSGDVRAIEAMLAEGVVVYSDGGGKAFAARKPITGTGRVANLLEVVFRKLRRYGSLAVTRVNGRPGVVFTLGGRAFEVMTIVPDAAAGSVGRVYIVLNPDKLRLWSDPGETASSANDRPESEREETHASPRQLHEAVEGAASGAVCPGKVC